ncbi:MAG: S-methyl-5'-thioadenosine phosphorylase [Candidatus Bathyarchaeia archaeon]
MRLKSLKKKTEIAILGGTGLETLVKNAEHAQVGTPYGIPPRILIGTLHERQVAFLPRHGANHTIPPHKVNYRANIYALYQLGVQRIIATNAVGAINKDLKPGKLVIPHDFIDFTKLRPTTFYESAPVTHVDMSQPYCPEIRASLIKAAKQSGIDIWENGVLVCTEGPRLETPAEIEMFRRLGVDVVGMTGVPEAVLARELGICYAPVCFVTNMAAGMQKRLTTSEVRKVAKKISPALEKLLRETVKDLSIKRNCLCPHALEHARF